MRGLAKTMNNPAILDIALGFVLHKHSKDEFGRKNNKTQAIRELKNLPHS
jgi:hypothetical protein